MPLDPPVRRTPGKPRTAWLTLRVTTDALHAIDQLAAREDRTRSDMARVLLQGGLRDRQTR